MAYYDHRAAMREKACADKYEELKQHITSKGEDGDLNQWILAHSHIVKLERETKEMQEQIKEYSSFFSLMRKLLPRTPSIHDVIG